MILNDYFGIFCRKLLLKERKEYLISQMQSAILRKKFTTAKKLKI
jgi:hypothetical protein